jgi:putative DNA primase/helicase
LQAADGSHPEHASPSTTPAPRLQRITEVPVFVLPGRLEHQPGYDADSQVYYAPYDPTVSLSIPSEPTVEDRQAACALINELYEDFPFTGEAERTHAVALLLLVYFVRNLIEGPVPAHLFEAPDAGTGKTLLATMLLYPAVGMIGTTSEPGDETEWKKVLTTVLVTGRPVFFLDNVGSTLNGASLKALLTADHWQDRLLGLNKDVCLPIRLIAVITANNVILGNEIARRVVRTRLDPRVDRPWLRDGFRHQDLPAWVQGQRPALIRAALTLVQAWLQAGCPAPTAKPLGSYVSWSTIIGGILEFSGYEHFLGNTLAFYDAADSDGATWRMFTSVWWGAHHDQPVSVKDLFPIAESLEGLNLGKAANERGQRTTLGRQLKKRRDQVIGDYRIEAAGSVNNAALWRLSMISTSATLNPAPPPSPTTEEVDLYVD